MTTSNRYWLARWIDECAIQSEGDMERCLTTQSSVQKIIQLIMAETSDPLTFTQIRVSGGAIAGRGVDLSGMLTCQAYECQRKIIDNSFVSILHYFDSIVVEGLSPHRALTFARHDPSAFAHSILEHGKTLLYLREIGAEPFVIFVEKPGLCEHHFNEGADRLRVFSAFDKSDNEKLVSRILRTSAFDIREVDGGHWVRVDGPLFQEPVTYLLKDSQKPTKKSLADYVAKLYSGSLVTDAFTAGLFNLPLAEAGSAAWLLKGHRRAQPTEADVAIQLNLPVLDRLDLGSFLKLREDEREAFESFRTALTAAISEQLSKKSTATQAAAAVVKEFVAPSLAEIERRAASSRRVLLRKSALDFSVGTAATIVGLTASIPLVLTGTAAAVAASLDVVHKYIDTRDSVRLSDCYFLWRAKRLVMKHE